ncbi:MAG: beta-1,4-galactosyltransferase [archaeon]|nr:MAG: beta-1,4-galactosyltransferase [archaeon]
MIFVTVGTDKTGFNRLIKKIDQLVGSRKIKEKVVMNIGYSNYIPKKTKYFKVMDRNRWNDYMKKADIILCHAGTGSLLSAIRFKRKIITIPRLPEHGEVCDNHQMEIIKELEKSKQVLACRDLNKLPGYIKKAKKFRPKFPNKKAKIFYLVNHFLKDLENGKKEL